MFDVRIATGQDTDSLDSLYHHLHSETPLSFRRSSAYRRCWIEPRLREMQSETIVAVVDGFIGAYVIVKRCVPSPEIVEWAGESAPLEVLLRYVWDRYCADSDSVVIANGSSPAIIQACHRVFTAVETMSYKEAMVASVDVSQWMVGLVPHLTESWLIAGKPQGCVTVRDRQGAITLTTKNGAPRAVPAAPGSPEITGARWVRMILGDQTAMPSNEEPELSWLSNLLPVRPGIFWEADAF